MTKEEQEKLLEENYMIYIGKGPQATHIGSEGMGWHMRPELYAKCIKCGYYMSLSKEESEQCFCGTLTKDYDWGRFESRLGDNSIEIYRIKQKIDTTSNVPLPSTNVEFFNKKALLVIMVSLLLIIAISAISIYSKNNYNDLKK